MSGYVRRHDIPRSDDASENGAFRGNPGTQSQTSRGRLEQVVGSENMGHGCRRQWAGCVTRGGKQGWVGFVVSQGFLGIPNDQSTKD